MRYPLKQLPRLLANPVGRSQILTGQLHGAWPLLSRAAKLYRIAALRRLQMVTVVGSLGKTTATRAASVALGIPLYPRMSLNDKAFLPFQVLRISPFARRGIVEVGIDRPGQMIEFSRMVRPDVTLVTAVASQHKRSLGSIERTRDEKADMVRALPASGCAVLNADDPNVMWMGSQTNARILTYGRAADADVRLLSVEDRFPDGLALTIETDEGRRTVVSPLIGAQMAHPLLLAVAAAKAVGIPLSDSARRLEQLTAAPGRMQLFRLDNGALLIGDYSTSSVDTVEAALDALAAAPAKRKLVVLGDLTEVSVSPAEVYRGVGARVAQIAQAAAFFGEKAKSYRSGAIRAGFARDQTFVTKRRLDAIIDWAQNEVREGDVVLLKARHNQRFDRIAHALNGRKVRCNLRSCGAAAIECDACAMLGRSWRDRDRLD